MVEVFAADGEEVGLGLGAADVVQKPPGGVHAQAEVVHVLFHFVHLAFLDVVFGGGHLEQVGDVVEHVASAWPGGRLAA